MTGVAALRIFAYAFLFLTARTFFWQGLQFVAARLPYFRERQIYLVTPSPDQFREELRANIIYLGLESAFWTMVLGSGILPQDAGHGLLTFGYSFGLSYMWWELSYYLVHRALHHPRLYFIHRHHHLSRVNTPLSGSSFSALEGILFLVIGWGPLMVLGHYWPLSYLGAFAYNELLMCIRTTGHFNAEMMPPWCLDLPGLRWIQTNTYHALHHARFKGHYGLMTVLPDRWGKTAFADYRLVQARAFQKEGLRSLNQRVSEESSELTIKRSVA